jgi:hypothetical protein
MSRPSDFKIDDAVWLGKDEAIPRAQPIKAKRRGCARGIGEDFPDYRFEEGFASSLRPSKTIHQAQAAKCVGRKNQNENQSYY